MKEMLTRSQKALEEERKKKAAEKKSEPADLGAKPEADSFAKRRALDQESKFMSSMQTTLIQKRKQLDDLQTGLRSKISAFNQEKNAFEQEKRTFERNKTQWEALLARSGHG